MTNIIPNDLPTIVFYSEKATGSEIDDFSFCTTNSISKEYSQLMNKEIQCLSTTATSMNPVLFAVLF